MLLTANFKDTSWNGIIVKKGQVITGTGALADSLGFTRQQIRTALKKLKLTNEITTESTNKYTIITIVNWDEYQSDENYTTINLTNCITNEQPTTNQQLTNKQPQRKNDKNDKKEKNIPPAPAFSPVGHMTPEERAAYIASLKE